MSKFPTHRHKVTGDICFPDNPEELDQLEKLPRGYWKQRIRTEVVPGKLDTIKKEASRQITEVVPAHKQLNMLWDLVEQLFEEMELTPRNADAFRKLGTIRKLRAQSNEDEQQVLIDAGMVEDK